MHNWKDKPALPFIDWPACSRIPVAYPHWLSSKSQSFSRSIGCGGRSFGGGTASGPFIHSPGAENGRSIDTTVLATVPLFEEVDLNPIPLAATRTASRLG
jgi:hypothetical protein